MLVRINSALAGSTATISSKAAPQETLDIALFAIVPTVSLLLVTQDQRNNYVPLVTTEGKDHFLNLVRTVRRRRS